MEGSDKQKWNLERQREIERERGNKDTDHVELFGILEGVAEVYHKRVFDVLFFFETIMKMYLFVRHQQYTCDTREEHVVWVWREDEPKESDALR